MTTKRDLLFSLLPPHTPLPGTPAAFFLHFDPACHRGQAAIDKHLEFFRFTGMDLLKIQYENKFPRLDWLQKPQDWARMPFYGLDFYAEPIKMVEGLVKAAKKEAVVVLTLYSPYMCARHTTSEALLTRHIQEDPEMVRVGMQVITESLLGFVRECIRLGLDGFYASTQGGEDGRFSDPALFDRCVRPYDLALMEEIDRACEFSILHVCDYELPYRSLEPFKSYPGKMVSVPTELTSGHFSLHQAAELFKRPLLGGLERKGVIATGNVQQIRAAVEAVLKDAPERLMLGADCTVPNDTPWENLRAAIETAHNFRR